MLGQLLAIVFALLLIGFAYHKRRINAPAALAAFVLGVGMLWLLDESWPYVCLLFLFFLLAILATAHGESVKEQREVAEKMRGMWNVLGNGLSPLIFSSCYCFTSNPSWLLATAGAIATATADTLATEIGQVYEPRPWLITELKRVKVGTSGAVSLQGLGAALLGALAIAIGAEILGGCALVPVFVAGVIGCVADSYLGAKLELGSKPKKQVVNFLATAFGGLMAASLSSLLAP